MNKKTQKAYHQEKINTWSKTKQNFINSYHGYAVLFLQKSNNEYFKYIFKEVIVK